jgi:deoxycytidine triphosphate deaminase
MMLTAKQILQEKLITNVDNPKCIQQVGIDLEVVDISTLTGVTIIPSEGKTLLCAFEKIQPIINDTIKSLLDREQSGWLLKPDYYQVTFKQGCKLPGNRVLQIIQRSSLCRGGGITCSGLYDPGFQTDALGSSILITKPIYIEYGARICQAFVNKCSMVDNKYKGQFQNDAQRSSG